VKFKYLESWHRARRRNAERYDKLFGQTGLIEDGNMTTPARMWTDREVDHAHVFNQYVIRVKQGRRDELRAYLADASVGTEIYYPVPFHLQECFKYLGYKRGDFPHAETAAREVLALPIYPELTADMQEYVVEKIVAFFRA